jgi:protein-L-isoaspartate(D-aspartate) O-methyltransferase
MNWSFQRKERSDVPMTKPSPGSRRRFMLQLAGAALALQPVSCVPASDWASMRQRMVKEIEQTTRETAMYTGQRTLDPRVLEVMGRVPRHLFVPASVRTHAYDNRPLPIGAGQTISQPFIVALMTDLVRPRPGDTALEVGTGSGYQAAVLAQLCKSVYTIEIVESLGRDAAVRLRQLGYGNVEVRIGDGYAGWPERAPFNVIVVTAGAEHVPAPLIAQLARGGRMVIPVGASPVESDLLLLEKQADGSVRTRSMLPVSFVPLTRGTPR